MKRLRAGGSSRLTRMETSSPRFTIMPATLSILTNVFTDVRERAIAIGRTREAQGIHADVVHAGDGQAADAVGVLCEHALHVGDRHMTLESHAVDHRGVA